LLRGVPAVTMILLWQHFLMIGRISSVRGGNEQEIKNVCHRNFETYQRLHCSAPLLFCFCASICRALSLKPPPRSISFDHRFQVNRAHRKARRNSKPACPSGPRLPECVCSCGLHLWLDERPAGTPGTAWPGRRRRCRASSAAEHKLARPFAGGSQVFIDSLAGLLGQFKPNRLPGLLADSWSIGCVAVWGNILDF